MGTHYPDHVLRLRDGTDVSYFSSASVARMSCTLGNHMKLTRTPSQWRWKMGRPVAHRAPRKQSFFLFSLCLSQRFSFCCWSSGNGSFSHFENFDPFPHLVAPHEDQQAHKPLCEPPTSLKIWCNGKGQQMTLLSWVSDLLFLCNTLGLSIISDSRLLSHFLPRLPFLLLPETPTKCCLTILIVN